MKQSIGENMVWIASLENNKPLGYNKTKLINCVKKNKIG